jgi:RNA polymerase sigma factor (sigma-70 family)
MAGAPVAIRADPMEAIVHPRIRRRRSGALLRAASDERLVARMRAGDDGAFEVLYDRHHQGLLAFCRHMLGSPEEAEDAVQHVFLAVHRRLRTDARPVQLKPWLYAVARNRCISVLRARRDAIGLDEAGEPSADGLAVAAEVERRQDLRDLLGDLRRLPDDQRAALLLTELGALSHDEVAVALGVPRAKVKALVFQARESLMISRKARDVDCREIQEQLATLRGGALRRASLRRHVAVCPACAAFEDEVRRQRRALGAVLPVVPSAMLKPAVLSGMAGGGASAAGATAAGGTVAGVAGAAGSGLAGAGVAAKVLVAAAVIAGGGAAARDIAHHRSAPAAGSVPAPASSTAPPSADARHADEVTGAAPAPEREAAVATSPAVAAAPRRAAGRPGRHRALGHRRVHGRNGHRHAPGRSATSPGHTGTAPGRSGSAPGLAGTTPGRSGSAPAHARVAPPHPVRPVTAPTQKAAPATPRPATRPSTPSPPAARSGSPAHTPAAVMGTPTGRTGTGPVARQKAPSTSAAARGPEQTASSR